MPKTLPIYEKKENKNAMERATGIEPATFRLEVWCSTVELHPHISSSYGRLVLAGAARFERATYGFKARCSTTELRPIKFL